MDHDREGMFRGTSRRELLEQMLRVVAALDGADAFPQDRAGIEALLGRVAEGRPSERREIRFLEADALPRYTGTLTTWISAAGDGAVRARRESFDVGMSTDAVVLHADGRTGEFEIVEGFGVPATELTEQARADLEAREREQREHREAEPQRQREREEEQVRFQTANLIRTVAAPAGQDPGGPVVAYAVLYATGVTIDYLVPRPDQVEPSHDDPWAEPLMEAMFPEVMIDDGLGTEYKVVDLGHVDANSSPLRGRLAFAPPVPDAARSLRISIGGATVELGLEER